MKTRYLLFCFPIFIFSCATDPVPKDQSGVSLELAEFRKENYHDVEYNLSFSIPADKGDPVTGSAEITFDVAQAVPLVLDFTGAAEDIHDLTLNGSAVEYTFADQHIMIAEKHVAAGENTVGLGFRAGDQSLNRRDDFLYTLLVPDRARTVFPCFDQPNLKARFTLSLEVPAEWTAVGNGSCEGEQTTADGRKKIAFRATEPISTYLFSFVAGKFDRLTATRDGREISLFHRETDPAKIAQCGDILDEVFDAVEWMEEYTDVPYPFEKYDLIIVPGFQYGGMEHMGATLYNDRRMFLENNATTADSLNRSTLIAHETAHMWFGDFVTMEWFNDVWNKEVFANWFAARMVEPRFPGVNHRLNFIDSYYPSAYTEDRTGGAMPIQQPLDNLANAGLIYSNIVYNKSPIVMEMLVRKIGDEAFRDALGEYLKTYAYGNADWDKLVSILDARTDEDLRAWSDTWVKEKGMPTVTFAIEEGQVNITQSDPWGRGRLWPQRIQFAVVDRAGTYAYHTVQFSTEEISVDVPAGSSYIIPNTDGRAYGYFKTDADNLRWLMEQWDGIGDEVARYSVLLTLYEAAMNLDLGADELLAMLERSLGGEANPQIFRTALECGNRLASIFGGDGDLRGRYETFLRSLMDNSRNPEHATLALQALTRLASSAESLAAVYLIWNGEDTRFPVSERDLIGMAYRLALFDYEPGILETQLGRITNPDRRTEFAFVSRALVPDEGERDAFFAELLEPASWQVEPWAISALGWLNDAARYPHSLEYVRPALETLRDVQREGDIFFPANWCATLLGGHTSQEALDIVERFLKDNPAYPALLESKIRLRADQLYIATGQIDRRYR